MAVITFNDVKCSLTSGTTWGTAADDASSVLLHFDTLTIDDNYEVAVIRTAGSNSPADIKRLGYAVSVSGGGTIGFNDDCWRILGHLLGDVAAGSEQTSMQGDYLHVIQSDSSTIGHFLTMNVLNETDQSYEIPSIKVTNFDITAEANGLFSWSFSAVGDRVLSSGDGDSPTNNAASTAALSVPAVEKACLGGANMYVRHDDYSTSVSLSSADDQAVSSFSLSIARPFDNLRVTNGSDTEEIIEPHQTDDTSVTLTLQYEDLDNGTRTLRTDRSADTAKAFELYVDGDQIGSGNNADIKIQIPHMLTTNIAPYNVARGTRIREAITYRATVPAADQSGMANISDLIGVSVTNSQNTEYDA